MNILNTLDRVGVLSSWVLGLVFIYAGALKLLEPDVFAVLIDAFGILPEMLVRPVAVALPMLEVAAGLGMLFNIRGSLGIIAALLLLFVVILAYGIDMGLDVDCGCFGPEDPESRAFHGLRTSLFRDLAMLAGIAWLYAWRRYRSIRPLDIRSIFNSPS